MTNRLSMHSKGHSEDVCSFSVIVARLNTASGEARATNGCACRPISFSSISSVICLECHWNLHRLAWQLPPADRANINGFQRNSLRPKVSAPLGQAGNLKPSHRLTCTLRGVHSAVRKAISPLSVIATPIRTQGNKYLLDPYCSLPLTSPFRLRQARNGLSEELPKNRRRTEVSASSNWQH